VAKSSGITTTVTLDNAAGAGQNISNDVLSLELSTPRGLIDITGLDKSAIERLPLLADGQVTLNMAFNPTATTGQHDVCKTMTSSAVTRTIVIVYNTTPSATMTMEVLFSDYNVNRGADGSLMATATGQLANGTVPAWT